MRHDKSFTFLNPDLQDQLIALVNEDDLPSEIDEEGVIYYSAEVEDRLENDLICSIRSRVFPKWQTITCPTDWVNRYTQYLISRNIPFYEEEINGHRWFLIPGNYRPHLWKIV